MSNTIGNNIRIARTKSGLTQKELANRLFVTQQAITKWETGKSMPQADKLSEIAKVCGTSVMKLMYDDETYKWHKSDLTVAVKENIAKLEKKQASGIPLTNFEYFDLLLSKKALDGNSPNTGGPGEYYCHIWQTDYEKMVEDEFAEYEKRRTVEYYKKKRLEEDV